jgi:hypothetical protein
MPRNDLRALSINLSLINFKDMGVFFHSDLNIICKKHLYTHRIENLHRLMLVIQSIKLNDFWYNFVAATAPRVALLVLGTSNS